MSSVAKFIGTDEASDANIQYLTENPKMNETPAKSTAGSCVPASANKPMVGKALGDAATGASTGGSASTFIYF